MRSVVNLFVTSTTLVAVAKADTTGTAPIVNTTTNPTDWKPIAETSTHSSLPHEKHLDFYYDSSDLDNIEVDITVTSSDESDSDQELAPRGVLAVSTAGARGILNVFAEGFTFSTEQVCTYKTNESATYSLPAATQAAPSTGNTNIVVSGPTPTALLNTITSFPAVVVTSTAPACSSYYKQGYEAGLRAGFYGSNGFYDGFNQGEADGFSTGYKDGYRAAQTGTAADNFKEAYLEGETHGYYNGYLNGDMHNSFEYTQTYLPDLGQISKVPYITSDLPDFNFSKILTSFPSPTLIPTDSPPLTSSLYDPPIPTCYYGGYTNADLAGNYGGTYGQTYGQALGNDYGTTPNPYYYDHVTGTYPFQLPQGGSNLPYEYTSPFICPFPLPDLTSTSDTTVGPFKYPEVPQKASQSFQGGTDCPERLQGGDAAQLERPDSPQLERPQGDDRSELPQLPRFSELSQLPQVSNFPWTPQFTGLSPLPQFSELPQPELPQPELPQISGLHPLPRPQLPEGPQQPGQGQSEPFCGGQRPGVGYPPAPFPQTDGNHQGGNAPEYPPLGNARPFGNSYSTHPDYTYDYSSYGFSYGYPSPYLSQRSLSVTGDDEDEDSEVSSIGKRAVYYPAYGAPAYYIPSYRPPSTPPPPGQCCPLSVLANFISNMMRSLCPSSLSSSSNNSPSPPIPPRQPYYYQPSPVIPAVPVIPVQPQPQYVPQPVPAPACTDSIPVYYTVPAPVAPVSTVSVQTVPVPTAIIPTASIPTDLAPATSDSTPSTPIPTDAPAPASSAAPTDGTNGGDNTNNGDNTNSGTNGGDNTNGGTNDPNGGDNTGNGGDNTGDNTGNGGTNLIAVGPPQHGKVVNGWPVAGEYLTYYSTRSSEYPPYEYSSNELPLNSYSEPPFEQPLEQSGYKPYGSYNNPSYEYTPEHAFSILTPATPTSTPSPEYYSLYSTMNPSYFLPGYSPAIPPNYAPPVSEPFKPQSPKYPENPAEYPEYVYPMPEPHVVAYTPYRQPLYDQQAYVAEQPYMALAQPDTPKHSVEPMQTVPAYNPKAIPSLTTPAYTSPTFSPPALSVPTAQTSHTEHLPNQFMEEYSPYWDVSVQNTQPNNLQSHQEAQAHQYEAQVMAQYEAEMKAQYESQMKAQYEAQMAQYEAQMAQYEAQMQYEAQLAAKANVPHTLADGPMKSPQSVKQVTASVPDAAPAWPTQQSVDLLYNSQGQVYPLIQMIPASSGVAENQENHAFNRPGTHRLNIFPPTDRVVE